MTILIFPKILFVFLFLRDKYIAWLRRWIGVDIYGKCGDKQCGEVKNIGHEYSTAEDPCFHMVNRNYRSPAKFIFCVNEFMTMNCCFDVSNLQQEGPL